MQVASLTMTRAVTVPRVDYYPSALTLRSLASGQQVDAANPMTNVNNFGVRWSGYIKCPVSGGELIHS